MKGMMRKLQSVFQICRKRSAGRGGFSLIEILTVVGLTGVVLGIGAVSVAQYQKTMSQMELDTVAKEIYFAAQNHMTLEKTLGRLKMAPATLFDDGGDGNHEDPPGSGEFTSYQDQSESHDSDINYRYLAHSRGEKLAGNLATLLPFASLDEQVRYNGTYIIRYNQKTGLVLDVFYSNEMDLSAFPDEADLMGADDATDSYRANTSKRKSYPNGILGYYGSQNALERETPPGVLDGLQLAQPTITSVNTGDVLSVTVGVNGSLNNNLVISGTLEESGLVELLLVVKGVRSGAEASVPITDSNQPVPSDKYTVILDDVTDTSGGVHFARLVSGMYTGVNVSGTFQPGEDLSFYALIQCNTQTNNGPLLSASRTANSLFGAEIGTGATPTAAVSSFRHLENLDPSISEIDYSVTPITAATQKKNLDWAEFYGGRFTGAITDSGGSDKAALGTFAPVKPGTALAYHGSGKTITGVVTSGTGSQGLFSELSNSTVENLTLVNFNITSTNGAAGALAGTMSGGSVTNVGVYNDYTKLDGATDDSALNITGGTAAGGLVGSLVGGAATGTITRSMAAVYVRAEAANGVAGGLVGAMDGGTVSASYAGGHTKETKYGEDTDNAAAGRYNVISTSGTAGGLIGTASGPITIEDAYSTASVYGKTLAGGFLGSVQSGVSGTIDHTYCTGLVGTSGGTAGAYISETIGITSLVTDSHFVSTINSPTINGALTGKLTAQGTASGSPLLTDASNPSESVPYDEDLAEKMEDPSDSSKILARFQTIAEWAGLSGTVSDFLTKHYGDWQEQNDNVLLRSKTPASAMFTEDSAENLATLNALHDSANDEKTVEEVLTGNNLAAYNEFTTKTGAPDVFPFAVWPKTDSEFQDGDLVSVAFFGMRSAACRRYVLKYNSSNSSWTVENAYTMDLPALTPTGPLTTAVEETLVYEDGGSVTKDPMAAYINAHPADNGILYMESLSYDGTAAAVPVLVMRLDDVTRDMEADSADFRGARFYQLLENTYTVSGASGNVTVRAFIPGEEVEFWAASGDASMSEMLILGKGVDKRTDTNAPGNPVAVKVDNPLFAPSDRAAVTLFCNNGAIEFGPGIINNAGVTQNISSFRHLENLNASTSNVNETVTVVTAATLIDDLDWSAWTSSTHLTGRTYAAAQKYVEDGFYGIYNTKLNVLNGQDHTIKNLSIKGELAGSGAAPSKYTANAGLFRALESNKVFTLRQIHLSDAAVTGGAGGNAGGLVGEIGTGTNTITLNNVLAEGAESAVTASGTNANAGGLVGKSAGGLSIENSAASVYVKSSGAAGGLVGQSSGAVTLTKSYAGGHTSGGKYKDSDTGAGRWNVRSDTAAGGLVGSVTGGTLSIGECFSAASAKANNGTATQPTGGIIGKSTVASSGITFDDYVYTAGPVSNTSKQIHQEDNAVIESSDETKAGAFIGEGQYTNQQSTVEKTYYLPQLYKGYTPTTWKPTVSGTQITVSGSDIAFAGTASTLQNMSYVTAAYYNSSGSDLPIAGYQDAAHYANLQHLTTSYDTNLTGEFPFSVWTVFPDDWTPEGFPDSSAGYIHYFGDWAMIQNSQTTKYRIYFTWRTGTDTGAIMDTVDDSQPAYRDGLYTEEGGLSFLPAVIPFYSGYTYSAWELKTGENTYETVRRRTDTDPSGQPISQYAKITIPSDTLADAETWEEDGYTCITLNALLETSDARLVKYHIATDETEFTESEDLNGEIEILYPAVPAERGKFDTVLSTMKIQTGATKYSELYQPKPNFAGYIFREWVKADGSPVDFTDNTPIPASDTDVLDLYASFVMIRYYTVTLNYLYPDTANPGSFVLSGVRNLRQRDGAAFDEEVRLLNTDAGIQSVKRSINKGTMEELPITSVIRTTADPTEKYLKINGINETATYIVTYERAPTISDYYRIKYEMHNTTASGSNGSAGTFVYSANASDTYTYEPDASTLYSAEDLTTVTLADIPGFKQNGESNTVNAGTEADPHIVTYHYYRKTYTLSFDSNGGTPITKVTGAALERMYGAPIGTFTDTASASGKHYTVRAGYNFTGWNKWKETGDSTETYDLTAATAMPASNVTILASWQAKPVNYYVVFWKQKVTDDPYAFDDEKDYDYEDMVTRTGLPGETANLTSNDTSKDWTGFQYNANNSDTAGKTIAADGSTVLNVRYDRKVHTLDFQVYTKAYTYTETTSETTPPDQYGLVGGTYPKLTRATHYRDKYVEESGTTASPQYGKIGATYVELTKHETPRDTWPPLSDENVDTTPQYAELDDGTHPVLTKKTRPITTYSATVNTDASPQKYGQRGGEYFPLTRYEVDVYNTTTSNNTTPQQYGKVGNEYVELTRRDVYTWTIPNYTKTNSSSGTQYGIVDGEYVRITKLLGSWWNGISQYTGTRYKKGNDVTYTGTRYTKSGNTYTATTGTTGTQYGKDNNGVYLQLTKSNSSTGYVWYYTSGGTETEYTGTRYTKSTAIHWKFTDTGAEYTGTLYTQEQTQQIYWTYQAGGTEVEYTGIRHKYEQVMDVTWTYQNDSGEDVSYTGTRYIKGNEPYYTWTYTENGQTIEYRGTRYTRSNKETDHWHTVCSITALYEARVGMYFDTNNQQYKKPLADAYKNYTWSDVTSPQFYSYPIKSIEDMPDKDLTFQPYRTTTSNDTIYYYVETLPGESGTSAVSGTSGLTGKKFKLLKTIKHNFNYLTYDEEFYDILGFSRGKKQAYKNFGDNNRAEISSSGNYLYYTRETKALSFFDTVTNTQYTSGTFGGENVPYEAKLSNYFHTSATPATSAVGDYHWDGKYYKDQACSEEFDLSNDTMPSHPLVVYFKFTLPKFTVSFPSDASYKAPLSGDQSYMIEVTSGQNIGSVIATDSGNLLDAYTPVPSNSNLTFDGWYYKDSSNEEQPFYSSMAVTQNISLYAKWIDHSPKYAHVTTRMYCMDVDDDGNPVKRYLSSPFEVNGQAADDQGTPYACDSETGYLDTRAVVGNPYTVSAPSTIVVSDTEVYKYNVGTRSADVDKEYKVLDDGTVEGDYLIELEYTYDGAWDYTVQYYIRLGNVLTLTDEDKVWITEELSDTPSNVLVKSESEKTGNQYEVVVFQAPAGYEQYKLSGYEVYKSTDPSAERVGNPGTDYSVMIHADKETRTAVVKYYLEVDTSDLEIDSEYGEYDGDPHMVSVGSFDKLPSVNGIVYEAHRQCWDLVSGDRYDNTKPTDAGIYSETAYVTATFNGEKYLIWKTADKDTSELFLYMAPRAITAVSASASKAYSTLNGVPLAAHSITFTYDHDASQSAFPAGQGAAADQTFAVDAFRRSPGTSYNVFDVKLDSGTKADNYSITKVYGTLTVTNN